VIALAISTLICAILYRLGGIGKPFASWQRDWLIPPIIYGLWGYLHHTNLLGWLLVLPAIALTGGALTTYWDNLSSNGEGNFYVHGFMVGLGAFPLFFAGTHWYLILVRCLLLALLIGQLNYWVNKKSVPFRDWIEELGRGALIASTIILL
jgi:hypothetical protein